ncbi:MAG: hypothetical protein KDK11_05915 [Maritimibacter sp.]|nr:hypothetical protein [Maritimibacter sp.]
MDKADCPGCQARFDPIDGPTHAYLTVSPACWARFGQALALHFSDYRFWPAHQLLTDAYVLQHSRGQDPRAVRSAHIHLAALYSQIGLGQPETRVVALRQALAGGDFQKPQPRWPRASVTMADVDLTSPARHLASVRAFAQAVLTDWKDHHELAARLCAI